MRKIRSLELRLLNYFLLITIAAIMIGVEFYFELSRSDLQDKICNITASDSADISTYAFSDLRNKIVVMFGVLSIVAAIVLLMFVKTISMPLKHILTIAERINNEGDLRQVIKIDNDDEIGQLSTVINDLASNLQEIVATVSTLSTEIESKLGSLSKPTTASNTEEHRNTIASIRSHLATMRAFGNGFNLLATDVSYDK